MDRRKKHPAGIEIRTHRSGRQTIRIDFTFRGVRCRETLALEPSARNLKYAANLRAEIQRQIEIGAFRYADYFPDSPRARKFGHAVSRQTVGDALRDWLDDAEKTKTFSTWKSYRTSARTHLFPAFDKTRLVDLTPADIRELIRSMPTRSKTIRNVLLPLRGVLKRAVSDEVIEKNPMDAVDVDDLVSPDQKRTKYKVDPFTAEELAAVIAAAGELFGDNARNLVQFHAFTGLRTGELFGLTWSQVDGGTITIDRSIVHGRPASTKTEAGQREVPLPPLAAEALRRQRAVTQLRNGRVFLALNADKWPADYWKHYSAPFASVCERAGVRYRNPYQLRHTFASQMLSGGENPLMIAKIMGHADAQTLFRVYAKWIDQDAGFVSAWGQRQTLNDNA